MQIKNIKEPIVFIALKRVCNYMIDQVWTVDLFGDDIVEAEFKLAIAKSKEFKTDIETLSKLNTDLNWGQKKIVTDKTHWSITNGGDFNPWYNGDLTLENLLDSIEPLIDFETSDNQEIQSSELEHYYNFLREYCGKNDSLSSTESDIGKIKTIMISVSTGLSRIQDDNEEYQKIYKRLAEYYRVSKIKNPNNFSDLWEFYAYWKKHLNSYAERRAYVIKMYKTSTEITISIPTIKSGLRNYINSERIKELANIKNKKFDLTKLVQYCKELNIAFDNKCYLTTSVLLRSIIDHVSPIFEVDSFSKVANNYNGTRSFKDSMENLDKSLRKIADSYLHTHVRSREVLPNSNQVDFSTDLDVLLAEICRILK